VGYLTTLYKLDILHIIERDERVVMYDELVGITVKLKPCLTPFISVSR